MVKKTSRQMVPGGRKKAKTVDSETITVVADVHKDGDADSQTNQMGDLLNIIFKESNEK